MLQVIDDSSFIIEFLERLGKYSWFMEQVGVLRRNTDLINQVSFGTEVDAQNKYAVFYYFDFPEDKDNGFQMILMTDGSELEQEMYDIILTAKRKDIL